MPPANLIDQCACNAAVAVLVLDAEVSEYHLVARQPKEGVADDFVAIGVPCDQQAAFAGRVVVHRTR
ncbi:hypothetical protein AVL48_14655 [Amycolatopsis regifaucium]|uniref:Uncharacterized protein n=1 Tax=Amycolatopsis regifaucium TaxID=546365 RepID=A0A154M4U5_9PSEU|nr:hypothetical protein AVL48_14655 [Amycolatopsis regifaucium]